MSRTFAPLTLALLGCVEPPRPPVDCTAAPRPPVCVFETREPGAPPISVVAYGTSLTANGAWFDAVVTEIERDHPGAVVDTNAAESARNSVWGLEQLDARVLPADPDIVLVEFAVNDAYVPFAISLEASRANLRELHRRLRARRPDVRLIVILTNHVIGAGAAARPELDAYYRAWRETAGELGLDVIDTHSVWRSLYETDPAAFTRLVPDGLHPTYEGHILVNAPIIFAAFRGESIDAAALIERVR